jgi:AcrR family transcriptional regulator
VKAKSDNANDATPCAQKRNAGQTRERILASARVLFSRNGYANVGVREIATDAGIDPALICRYFGGKEGLFKEVIQGIFNLDDNLRNDPDSLGVNLVHNVLATKDKSDRLNRLNLLLCSVESPAMADIVSERFHDDFVLPLAALLGGKDAEARAGVIACYAIGLSTMRHALSSPVLNGDNKSYDKVVKLIAEAIQASARAT